ncbi:MAG: DNA-3-methyladenine glycosylase I [Actinomycetota bacterium]|nr:DNA-3-methyladenine glycosylase I [Actinomycetota bacterium]
MSSGLIVDGQGARRCGWCGDDPLYRTYHDTEWGFPVSDDRRLFEKICLEGFQAGLSWVTILRKRPDFRRAFEGFELEAVAGFDAADVERLLDDSSIVRNRAKIESTINNAHSALELIGEQGSLAAYFWRFEPSRRSVASGSVSPPVALSKDLKRRGWTFVGPTTAYAFMQAVGMVNDHLDGCDWRVLVEQARRSFQRPY